MTTSEQTVLPALGIIAGGGTLPRKLAEACAAQGRKCFIVALEGSAEVDAIRHYAHACVRLGAVGEALERLRSAGVQELVMAGQVKRPSMGALKPDAVGAKFLARLGLKLFGGDDALLKALVGLFEEEGFSVIGADAILGSLLMPEGILTKKKPDAGAQKDIAIAVRVAKALGKLDIGQAVIVENGYVLGVEAAEGTDALIGRCALLKREEHRAILVKMCKPGQESRADLPTVGPNTLHLLRECGMLGVAAEAGGSLLLEREEAVRLADENGLFIAGITE